MNPVDGTAYAVGYMIPPQWSWGAQCGPLPGQTSAGGSDLFIMKLSANGSVEWMVQYGGALDDQATSVAVNPADGAALVTGYTYGGLPGMTNTGAPQVFLLKFSAAGVLEWTAQTEASVCRGCDGSIRGHDRGTGIVVATDGTVIVAGTTHGLFPGQPLADLSTGGGVGMDIFLMKFR